jgi:hypothetical protein
VVRDAGGRRNSFAMLRPGAAGLVVGFASISSSAEQSRKRR